MIVTDRLEDLFCLFVALGAQPTTPAGNPGHTTSNHSYAAVLAVARSATLSRHAGRPCCHVVFVPDWALAELGQPPAPGPQPSPDQGRNPKHSTTGKAYDE